MKYHNALLTGILAVSLALAGQALAHTPLCSCYDNGAERSPVKADFPTDPLPRGYRCVSKTTAVKY